MRNGRLASVFLVLSGLALAGPALACDGGEAPTSCDTGGAENVARWMLGRVVSAMQSDKARALGQFTRGEAGFRTADTYVFCVGPDGTMTAHPDPALRGQDVRDLHDETGNHFIATMLANARPGQVAEIRYLFPRPGSSTVAPKTTFYTRAGDQVCGVGIYDGDPPPAAVQTPAVQAATLRQQLDGRMPPELRGQWTEFLKALDAENSARTAMLDKVRDSIRATEAVLAATTAPGSAPPR